MIITFWHNNSENITVDKNLTNSASYTGNPILPFNKLNPTIRIAMDSVPNYNYAYISETQKYYYVVNSVCISDGIWDITFKHDPLMNYKSEIRQNTAFVLKNEHTFNSLIPNYNIAKKTLKNTTILSNAIPIVFQPGHIYPWTSYSDYISNSSSDPHFVLAVSPAKIKYSGIQLRPPKHGMVLTIVNSLGQQILNKQMQVAGILDTDLNVSNFIHEFYYFPIMPTPTHLTEVTNLYFKQSWLDTLVQNFFKTEFFSLDFSGVQNVEDIGSAIYYIAQNEDDYIVRSRWVIPLTDHAPSDAKFLNANPFTNFVLHFLPFPDVQIDPTLFIDDNGSYVGGLGVEIVADYRTGDASLYVAQADPNSTTGDFGDKILAATANLKVSLPTFDLTNRRTNISLSNLDNLTTSKTTPVSGETTSAVIGNEEMSIPITKTDVTYKTVTGVNYAAAAKLGWDIAQSGYISTVNGTVGSMIEDSAPTLRVEYYEFTDPPASTLGNPLHEEKQLSDLSGFTVCGAVHLHGLSSALPEEITEIERILMSGVIL